VADARQGVHQQSTLFCGRKCLSGRREMNRIGTAGIRDAADLLVTCFSDDELIGAQLEGVSDRESFLRPLFEMQLRVFVKTMDVLSLDDGGDTLFVGFEKAPFSSLKSLCFSLLYNGTLTRSVPKDDLKVFGANSRKIASQFEQDWYKQHVSRNFYYIKIMAIDPSQRGQGKFRRLIEPILEGCRSRGLPVVLETNSATNCAIYEHFEFVREKTFGIQPNSFDIYCYVKAS
jgi:hypothetical protein